MKLQVAVIKVALAAALCMAVAIAGVSGDEETKPAKLSKKDKRAILWRLKCASPELRAETARKLAEYDSKEAVSIFLETNLLYNAEDAKFEADYRRRMDELFARSRQNIPVDPVLLHETIEWGSSRGKLCFTWWPLWQAASAFASKEAVSAIVKGIKDNRPETRMLCAYAAGTMREPSAARALKFAWPKAANGSPAQSLFALAAANIGNAAAVAFLESKFKPDRMQGAHAYYFALALGLSGRASFVDPLVDALSSEDEDLKKGANRALTMLTGTDLHGNRIMWRNWVEENRGSLADREGPPEGFTELAALAVGAPVPPPEDEKPEEGASYYGLHVPKRSIFVIDISESMLLPASFRTISIADGKVRKYKSGTKIGVAREELTFALNALKPDDWFNVVLFSEAVTPVKPEIVPAIPGNVEDVLKVVRTRKPNGTTNIYDALMASLVFAGPWLFVEHIPCDVDSIFFLTDGRPTEGDFIFTKDIMEKLELANPYARVAINTIGFGREVDEELLGGIAKKYRGTFVAIGNE